jgi:rSAM/selenodomain-associated transferase 1
MTILPSNPILLPSRIPGKATLRRLQSAVRKSSTLVLAGTALLSALIYWLVFVQPHSLLELYRRPLLDLYDLSKTDPLARWRLLGGFLSQAALYWLGWRVARYARSRAAWAIVLSGALASGLVLLFLYPYGAADVFDNIMHGRILSVHGANPFQQVAADFKTDPFYRYTAWRYFTSAYGPGWELLAGGTARLAGDAIITNVLAFKSLAAAFLLASVTVVAAILRRAAPERALAGVLLLAWNPVILYETFGQGHNDVAMVFWILVASLTLLHRRYTLAVLALVVGALFKFIPLLMLPAAILIALRDLPHARARARFLVVTFAGAALLVLLAYAPFWHGLDTLDVARRQELFTTSLPSVTHALLQKPLGREPAAAFVSRYAAGLTALFALGQALRAWRDRTWLGFPRAAFNTLMFYLLVTCLWFQSWYAVWPLGIAALLPPGHTARLGALFGFAVLSKPLIFGPLWLWHRPLSLQTWRELRLGPAVLALPWLYALFALWHTRRSKRRKEIRLMPHLASPPTGGDRDRSDALIVVAKRPAPGRTKTRLTPPLSIEQAAALYECLLRDTLDLVRRVPAVQPVIAYLPAHARDYFKELAPDFQYVCQEGSDLGSRLDNALTHFLELGYRRVVIMNSDGPTLPVTSLIAAFQSLTDDVDVVLGPCDDGGYYLIGLKRPAPRLLREVRMSTPDVVSDTMALATEEGLQVELLPVWYDVDDAASLARLAAELAHALPDVAPHTRAFLEGHPELLVALRTHQAMEGR